MLIHNRAVRAAAELGIPCVLHGIGGTAKVEEVVELAHSRCYREAALSAHPEVAEAALQ